MKNAVGTQADRQVFPQPYQVLSDFHECFNNSIETQQTCFKFLSENSVHTYMYHSLIGYTTHYL